MQCYECAKEEVESPAVAICPSCNCALCLRHLREAAAKTGPGGSRFGCIHDAWAVATRSVVSQGA